MAVFQGYPVFSDYALVFQLDLKFDQQVCNYGVALGATPSRGLEISMDIHPDSREFFHFGANKVGLCPTWPFPAHLNQKSWFSVFRKQLCIHLVEFVWFCRNVWSGYLSLVCFMCHPWWKPFARTPARTASLYPHNQSKYSLPTGSETSINN